MMIADIRCRLCNRNANEIGGWLKRLNPKGQKGVYECRSSCHAVLHPEYRIVSAIRGEEKERYENLNL